MLLLSLNSSFMHHSAKFSIMKKIILFTILLTVSAASFTQTINPSQPLTRADYVKKSKSQKTAAWVLLGGGFALSTTGALISSRKAAEDLAGAFTGVFFGDPEPQNNYTGETILLVGGVVAMLSSIPLFIASGKNRRKAAASVSFKMQNATNIYQSAFTNTRYPVLAIQIRL